MKLKISNVMFINLLFRIFLLMYLLKQDEEEATRIAKPLKHWLDPISKRVFLIVINGLPRDFLYQNSTPYLSEIVENYGSFGIALSSYMETNLEGLRTVLTGRRGLPFPLSYLRKYCPDSILDYSTSKCGIGNIPVEIQLECYFPDDDPLRNFFKFPGFLKGKTHKSSFYLIVLDFDPVWLKDYRSRLKAIDDGIQFFAKTIDRFYEDNKTTYIVTSSRSSPVGESLSVDSPVVAWGRGIAYSEGVTYLGKSDLTAMLCALLGINFPSGLFGIIPTTMMDLHDYYTFELTLYTIRHFERVLEVVDVKDQLLDTSELELEQLDSRLDHIILDVRKSKMKKLIFTAWFLILLLSLWGINLVTFSLTGFAYVFLHLKALFFLLVVVGATLTYFPSVSDAAVLLELIAFWTWQNARKVYEAFSENGFVIYQASFLIFIGVTAVGFIGNHVALPALFIPVVLWPVINRSYKRLNRFVFFTRLLSGIVLGILPFKRVFGETPDNLLVVFLAVLFTANVAFLFSLFKVNIDTHVKINFLMILSTAFCICLPRPVEMSWLKDIFTCLLLAFSLFSTFAASGALLVKLLKIFQSLFIPVLMLGFRIECIFYLSVVFQVFSWIFTEYHSSNLMELQFYPSIFSVRWKKSFKPIQFSGEDCRLVGFFLIYCYASYFAIGHSPDLHSYDLYVLPTFVYEYPKLISHFLGGVKFFVPFLVVTFSIITLCGLKEKDFDPIIMLAVWLSDVLGCVLVFYSQFFNLLFQRSIFPAKFSCFFIQQFATVSVILSYFMGKYLLLGSDRFWNRIFKRRKVSSDVQH